MLQNVFDQTRIVAGEKTLSMKYAPSNLAECCISDKDILSVKECLSEERFFSVRAQSGCGATTCIEYIAKDMGTFFVHQLSCSMGCTEIVKILTRNMQNVLLALQNDCRKILFMIKDIEMMKRNEKAQIINLIEQTPNLHAIVFYNNVLCYSKWRTIFLPPPEFYDKMVHLCWISAQENIIIELHELERLANFQDLRNAINSLVFKENTVYERDYSDVDCFSKLLFAHESMNCANIDSCSTFADLMCNIDVSEFKPTRYWYTQTAVEFIDKNEFVYNHKQSFIARNAQMTHRTSCIQKACHILSIPCIELKFYSFLYRHLVSSTEHLHQLLNKNSNDFKDKAKALYTVAKIGATPPQCKAMKKFLELT